MRKRKPYIVKEINKLHLEPEDILVIHFDIDNFDISDCNTMFHYIQKAIPQGVNLMALFGGTKLEIIENKEKELKK